MDAKHKSAPRLFGLLSWLGLVSDAQPAAKPPLPAAVPADPFTASPNRLGDEIGDFLTRHRLPATPLTIGAALDCASGNDPRFAERVAKRLASGEPVTLEWLADVRSIGLAEDESRSMTRLMDRLEQNMVEFGRTTGDARTAASAYNQALRIHVDDLHEVARAGAAITEMVAIARTMIERTHEVERQIAASELQTRQLHLRLEEARREAEIDHLTGLPNRRAFESQLEREIAAAHADGEPLCVAFCDIDRFKRINDTHGHDAGDRVLKAVGQALAAISNDRCHVARHGGEEFVVLLRGRDLAEAYDLLDEARADLAERRMVNRATEVPFGKVSFSAGIADVLAYADPRAALKAADEALYVAKNEGRNRIVRAPARLAPVPSPKAA